MRYYDVHGTFWHSMADLDGDSGSWERSPDWDLPYTSVLGTSTGGNWSKHFLIPHNPKKVSPQQFLKKKKKK